MKHALLSLCALLVIPSPSLNTAQVRQQPPPKPVTVTPLPPLMMSGERTSFMTSQLMDQFRLVVRDRDTWAQVWKQINAPSNSAPLPEIDFTREMLIVAAMGLWPSTGYRIIIDSALLYESYPRLEVVIRSIDTTKCPGTGVLTMMTAPVDIVRVPRTDRPVVMHEKEVTNECPNVK